MRKTSCGRYTYGVGRIGQGGEAEVFPGRSVACPSTRVAVKVLTRTASFLPPSEYVALREVPPHDGIVPVPVLTKCALTGRAALVFPLYLCDLHSVAERGGPLPEPLLRSVMVQLLRAVAHIHAAGYTHRDVKLENVFVASREGDGSAMRIVLGDFGLARRGERVHGRGVGTELFMAPEVAAAHSGSVSPCGYDPKAGDVWASLVVGLMCATLSGVAVGADGDLLLPEGEAWDALSPTAHEFFTAGLVVDPADRPSAAQLLKHLWLAPEM